MNQRRIAVFGPHPLLTVTVEPGDDIHVHLGGQGVWVARMAAELGAAPILCGFVGGETGHVVRSLMERVPWEHKLVDTATATGSYVVDRRAGERRLVALHGSAAPSRHELDDLLATTCSTALRADALVVCNPLPAEALSTEVYGSLVADVRDNGTPVLVDLSTPRLDSALEGRPDLVKLNDWELAEYVRGPVASPREMHAAAERLRDRGAAIVVVTRGPDPAFVLAGSSSWELTPPRFERGSREGCGDSMMGGIAAAWAAGADWQEALVTGAAAGAANFLRHGLGTGSRAVVDDLRPLVELHELYVAA